MKKLIYSICLLAGAVHLQAQEPLKTWGDQGNGTYVNPILNADYSDPDVIRVGDCYYMVASDFHYLGMQILKSEDMVNWKLIAQLYNRFDFPEWEKNGRYAGGSWAPAIRHAVISTLSFSFCHTVKVLSLEFTYLSPLFSK